MNANDNASRFINQNYTAPPLMNDHDNASRFTNQNYTAPPLMNPNDNVSRFANPNYTAPPLKKPNDSKSISSRGKNSEPPVCFAPFQAACKGVPCSYSVETADVVYNLLNQQHLVPRIAEILKWSDDSTNHVHVWKCTLKTNEWGELAGVGARKNEARKAIYKNILDHLFQ